MKASVKRSILDTLQNVHGLTEEQALAEVRSLGDFDEVEIEEDTMPG